MYIKKLVQKDCEKTSRDEKSVGLAPELKDGIWIKFIHVVVGQHYWLDSDCDPYPVSLNCDQLDGDLSFRDRGRYWCVEGRVRIFFPRCLISIANKGPLESLVFP